MSHFTVLVIGENPEEQLQPFHEYECTGIKDQYVIDVDKTDEVKEWLQQEIFVGKKKESGELDYEYREESAVETLVAPKKVKRIEYLATAGRDIDEEIKDWHGYDKRGDKWVKFTNPNRKWDWYVLGGRWTGFFKLKAGANGDLGSPSFFGEGAKPGYADAALKKNIDFDAMRNEAATNAETRYDTVMKHIAHLPLNRTWDEIRKENEGDVDNARNIYWSQERCKAFNKVRELFDISHNPDDFVISREQYVEGAKQRSISTFAVIKDGKWFEKGQMGWWALVANEKDQDEWNKEFAKLLDSIPDDTLISVYDCHI